MQATALRSNSIDDASGGDAAENRGGGGQADPPACCFGADPWCQKGHLMGQKPDLGDHPQRERDRDRQEGRAAQHREPAPVGRRRRCWWPVDTCLVGKVGFTHAFAPQHQARDGNQNCQHRRCRHIEGHGKTEPGDQQGQQRRKDDPAGAAAVQPPADRQAAPPLEPRTDMPLSAIAFAAGFGSLRRFNDAFRALYGRPPSSFRARTGTGAPSATQPARPGQPPGRRRCGIRD